MKTAQTTIAKTVSAESRGLHTGRDIQVHLRPSSAHCGIVFRRVDLPGASALAASVENVHSTQLATTLGEGENRVSTVEHLMAALAALGVDNVTVEVAGPELPIFDGSAARWVELLQEAGERRLAAPRAYLAVTRPFRFVSGDRSVEMAPAKGFSVEAAIEFNDGAIGRQSCAYRGGREAFIRELSRARTFCHIQDVEYMHAHGLALGGDLTNAVVIGEQGILNPEGLRYRDEFVRHKLLDFIGDMGMLGAPVLGRFAITKPGHELNHEFTQAALAEPGLLESVTFEKRSLADECLDLAARIAPRPALSLGGQMQLAM